MIIKNFNKHLGMNFFYFISLPNKNLFILIFRNGTNCNDFNKSFRHLGKRSKQVVLDQLVILFIHRARINFSPRGSFSLLFHFSLSFSFFIYSFIYFFGAKQHVEFFILYIEILGNSPQKFIRNKINKYKQFVPCIQLSH